MPPRFEPSPRRGGHVGGPVSPRGRAKTVRSPRRPDGGGAETGRGLVRRVRSAQRVYPRRRDTPLITRRAANASVKCRFCGASWERCCRDFGVFSSPDTWSRPNARDTAPNGASEIDSAASATRDAEGRPSRRATPLSVARSFSFLRPFSFFFARGFYPSRAARPRPTSLSRYPLLFPFFGGATVFFYLFFAAVDSSLVYFFSRAVIRLPGNPPRASVSEGNARRNVRRVFRRRRRLSRLSRRYRRWYNSAASVRRRAGRGFSRPWLGAVIRLRGNPPQREKRVTRRRRLPRRVVRKRRRARLFLRGRGNAGGAKTTPPLFSYFFFAAVDPSLVYFFCARGHTPTGEPAARVGLAG